MCRTLPDSQLNMVSGRCWHEKGLSISSFDKIYNEKIQKGYIDQSALHQTQVMVKSAYVPTLQPSVDWLINTLLNAANRAFKTEYTISADEITDRMIDEAQAMLLKLQNCTSVSTFNTILVNMFRTIPRRMRNVSDFLAQTESDFEKDYLPGTGAIGFYIWPDKALC